MARIFISHSSNNNAEALALREWLVSQGWTDLFLDIHTTDGLVPAERWPTALRASVARSRAVIFCLSPDWVDSPNCRAEFEGAMIAGASPLGVIVKPVAFGRIPAEMTNAWQLVDLTRGGPQQTFNVVPPPDRRQVAVAFPIEELKVLRAGLAKLGLVGLDTENFGWPPANEPDRAPYRGLEPLDAVDAGVFFGRDADLVRAREALLSLRAQGGRRLFVILGASGAGKSSFLRAGLLPRLAREDHDFFAFPVIRPAEAPVSGRTGFAQSLMEAFAGLGAARPLGDIKSTLARGPDMVPGMLAELQDRAAATLIGEGKGQIDRPPTLIVAIDQAEELYAAGANAEAQQFLDHLASAVTRGPETIALLTIRSDRFEPLQSLPALRGIPQEPFNLPPVTSFAFREAIVGPAARAHPPIRIDADLINQLLEDTAAQGADPLPLLAFTLERLYRNYGVATRLMSLVHYKSLGGISGSLNATLEEAFARPDTPPSIPADAVARERLLENVFVPALVDINEQNNQPLRRIAAEKEIITSGHGLVERLVRARLLVRGTRLASGAAQTTIEVAHEALLRQWDTLCRILDRRMSELKGLQALERAAQAWDNNKRASDWLDHKGERLAEAQALAERTDLATRIAGLPDEYLAACRKAEERARRDRKRALLLARLATYGILAIGLLALGGALWQSRETQRREATVMTSVAQRAIGEDQNERAMRAALHGLPTPLGMPWALGWSATEMRALEAKLAGAAQASLFQIRLKGHEREVRSATFSPDGGRVVTASDDGTARVWDAGRGSELLALKTPGTELRSAAFGPDGTRIVTASTDKLARVWDANSGTELLQLKGHDDQVFSAGFNHDGKRIVTASLDHTARVWDAKTGQELLRLDGHLDKVLAAAFSADGGYIVTASQDKTARIWDARTGTQVGLIEGHASGVRIAAFSPDGTRLVTGSFDYTARVWETKSGTQLFSLDGRSKPIRGVAFSADGRRIVTASDDGTARVWDAGSGAPVLELIGHGRAVVSAAFSLDGRRIVTASEDHTARLWNAKGSPELAALEGHEAAVLSATFSPDGTHIVTASSDRLARVWDARGGASILQLVGHSDWVRSAAFSADGVRIVTASKDRTVRVWDAKTGTKLLQLDEHPAEVLSAVFSPDGNRIVTASENGSVLLWDARSGARLLPFKGHDKAVWSLAFSPDGRRVVTASDDLSWRVWDSGTGAQLLAVRRHQQFVRSAAFSPDGTRVVTASWDHTARVWDARDGTELVRFPGGNGLAHGATFSPDGDRVVTAFHNNTAWVWDAKSGAALLRLKGHDGAVRGVAFSPDGARIATASQDRTARLWDSRWLVTLRTGQLARRVCHDKLVDQARFFTGQDEADDAILSGLTGKNACARHE